MPLRLLAPEGYHTIAELCAALGVSRQRAWQILRQLGLEPEKAAGRISLLTDAEYQAALHYLRGRPGRPRKNGQ